MPHGRLADLGGKPREIVYNCGLPDLARHYVFQHRACFPFRPKTKDKVERPLRHVRQDFFLGRSFRDLEGLNVQLSRWLDEVANARLHTTTKRIVAEAFADQKPPLLPLPNGPYTAIFKVERRGPVQRPEIQRLAEGPPEAHTMIRPDQVLDAQGRSSTSSRSAYALVTLLSIATFVTYPSRSTPASERRS